jgi:hypothetical protein
VQYRQGGLSSRSATNPDALLAHANNKYRRQLAVYTQITKDLYTIGQSHLSTKKIACYIKKSKVVLELINKQPVSILVMLKIAINYRKSPGVFWTLMRALYIKYPRVTIFLGIKI